jgi:hypothetical protein
MRPNFVVTYDYWRALWSVIIVSGFFAGGVNIERAVLSSEENNDFGDIAFLIDTVCSRV